MRRGKKFELLPWQLKFAGLVFDDEVQTALLSVARKNGKSSLLALLLAARLLTSARDRNVWDSAQSSVSASGGKSIILGTRLRGDLFESALDQARRGVEGVAALEFTVEPDCDIMDTAVWAAANPSLGSVKSLDYMRRAAAAADDPSLQPSFRAHDLNAVAEDDAETIVA